MIFTCVYLCCSDGNMSEELTKVGTVLYYQLFGHLAVRSFTLDYKKLMLTVPLPGIISVPCIKNCIVLIRTSVYRLCACMNVCVW